MKACVGVEVQLHQFLNSAIDEASSQVQASAPLNHRERPVGTHRIGGFVDSSDSLEM
jgi:hypothetical protein